MKANDTYLDLDGDSIPLGTLDAAERRLVAQLRRRAASNPDWNAFDNYWTMAVPAFYVARGLPRKAVAGTIPWRIAQDLSSRLGIAAGYIRPPDHLDDLEELVFIKHPSLRAFCKATGLSVGSIITREAKEKRIDKSGDVPTPLLLEEEHYELLSAVASEMWANNTEVLRSDLLDLV